MSRQLESGGKLRREGRWDQVRIGRLVRVHVKAAARFRRRPPFRRFFRAGRARARRASAASRPLRDWGAPLEREQHAFWQGENIVAAAARGEADSVSLRSAGAHSTLDLDRLAEFFGEDAAHHLIQRFAGLFEHKRLC